MAEQSTIQVDVLSIEAAVVSLCGEHDLESHERVTAAIMAAATSTSVVVDLTRCTFADSTIITALLRAARELDERGGALQLVVPPEARSIRRTLELMGVTGILRVHASRAESLEGSAHRTALRRAA